MSDSLQDSKILLRFVKPDDRDDPLVCTAVETLWSRGDKLYYTSQNLGEFWNTCTRPLDRNGFGCRSPKQTVARASLKRSSRCFRIFPRCMANGAVC